MCHQTFARFAPKSSLLSAAIQCPKDQLRFIELLIAIRLPRERSTHQIHIVFPASPRWTDARLCRAASKAGGKVRPRFVARRRIPAAAFGLKEYLLDTCGCRTADKEHTTATLGDSKILAVQHAVADHRPALPKSFQDRGHVPSAARAKQPWDIFKEPPHRLDGVRDPDDFPEEAGAFPGESGPLAGNAEVLAGEAAAEEINRFMPVARPLPHVRPAGSVWESRGKDSLTERLSFDLIGDGESSAFQSKVKPSYTSKETDGIHFTLTIPNSNHRFTVLR